MDNGFALTNENQCKISVAPNVFPGACYQITWNWGDNSPKQTVSVLDSFALSHVYPSTNSNELYEVCMSLELLENGDTLRQLLARSRYLLYKSSSKWTDNQSTRAKILFEQYPDIEKAYKLCQNLSWIFNQTKDKTSALIRLAKWDEKVRQAAFKSFHSISRTMSIHYKNILNYFDNRSTNASAESFNAKIKAFRAQFRGVRNVEFFLFRLANIFA